MRPNRSWREGEEVFRRYGWVYNNVRDTWIGTGPGWQGHAGARKYDEEGVLHREITIDIPGLLPGTETHSWNFYSEGCNDFVWSHAVRNALNDYDMIYTCLRDWILQRYDVEEIRKHPHVTPYGTETLILRLEDHFELRHRTQHQLLFECFRGIGSKRSHLKYSFTTGHALYRKRSVTSRAWPVRIQYPGLGLSMFMVTTLIEARTSGERYPSWHTREYLESSYRKYLEELNAR